MSGITGETIAAIVGAIAASVAVMGGFLIWAIRAMIAAELDSFAVRLNGTYWRSGEAKSEVRRLDGRIDGLEHSHQRAH